MPFQEFMLRAKNRRSQTRYRAKQKVCKAIYTFDRCLRATASIGIYA